MQSSFSYQARAFIWLNDFAFNRAKQIQFMELIATSLN